MKYTFDQNKVTMLPALFPYKKFSTKTLLQVLSGCKKLNKITLVGLLSICSFQAAFAQSISGSLTVNPALASSTTNFKRIGEVDTFLMTRGINGPVDIKIYNGTYTQANMVLNTVAGVSATNTIKFSSFSSDSLQVNIASLFSVINTPYVTLEKLKLAGGVSFSGATTTNCSLKNSNVLVSLNWNAGSNFTVENNGIVCGISISGAGSMPINNIQVKGNTILGISSDANGAPFITQWIYVNKPIFDNNKIRNISLSHYFSYLGRYYKGAMYYFACGDTAYIRSNQILGCSFNRFICDEADYPGLRRLAHLDMNNNFIAANGAFNLSLAANYDNRIALYGEPASISYTFNNYSSVNTVATSTATFNTGSSTFTNFKNNNFFSKAAGVVCQHNSVSSVQNRNYNNYKNASGTLIGVPGASYTSLAAYQAAGYEPNGKSVNPKYTNDTLDLHVKHPALLAAGTPAPTNNPILIDIDGDSRNQLNPCIGADEFQVPSVDVKLDSILVQKNGFSAETTQPVRVKFTNQGSAALSQVNINWSVNGVNQAPYVWTGTLPYDSTTNAGVAIGSYNFEMGKLSTLKVWSSMPNGALDMVNNNDTLQTADIIPYSKGSFTLGGTNPTFTNFRHADSILTRSGVDGAVTINIRNGKYTEQVKLKFVPGASLTNTITYKGENDNAALDTLVFANSGSDYYRIVQSATIRLDSLAFTTFKHITIQDANTTASSNTASIELFNKCKSLTFENCVFTGIGAALANGPKLRSTYNSIGIDSNLVVKNCLFTNGGGGINLEVKNATIKNNRFTNLNSGEPSIKISADASYFATTSGGTYNIDSNYIKNEAICTYLYGGTCYQYGTNSIGGISLKGLGTNNTGTVSHNQLYQSGALDIALNATTLNPIKVFNNFIGSSRTSIFGGSNIEVQHNSFADSIGTSTKIKVASTSLTFRNNIVVNGVPKQNLVPLSYAVSLIEITGNEPANIFSNNVYFNVDTAKFIFNGNTYAYSSLANWQNTQLKDVNSKFITTSPFINFSNNLHMNNRSRSAIDLVDATPISYINKDIDEESRNVTKPVIGADEFALFALDASANAIIGLANPLPSGNTAIAATVRNMGTNNITSAQVNWSVNGALQTPASFSGNLATSAISSTVSLGNFNFAGNTEYSIAVWTSNPNSGADLNISNDTIFTKVKPALCGTYTIGGTSPDFATPKAAMKYLMEAGVSCPVVFNIRNGVYVESDTLFTVKGTSSTNTITFQSESGDSSLVKISQSSSIYNSTIVLSLKDINYVNFKKIGFQRTLDPSYSYYFDLVTLSNVNNASFTNCEFKTIGTGSHIANTLYVTGLSGSTNDSSLNISNNRFIGGARGLVIFGRYSTFPINGLTVTNNKFVGFSGDASGDTYIINVVSARNADITNNFIDSTIAGSLSGGISFREVKGKGNISGNNIIKRKGSTGIFLDNVGGGITTADALIVANNMVNMDSTNAAVAFRASLLGNTKVLHNTVLSNNTNASSVAFVYQHQGTVTIKDSIRNNIFASLRGGITYSFINYSSAIFSSHNNIYAIGGSIFSRYNNTNYTTLAALQTASGMEANSKTLNPIFVSNTNLHVGEIGLNTAVPTIITSDIDGNTRSLTTPTIGADEIVINNNDAGIVAMPTPAVPFAAGSQNVNVQVRNFGSTTLTSATINWSINGALQTPFSFTGSVVGNSNSVATNIGSFSFNINTNYAIKIWTSNPNGTTDGTPQNDTLILNSIYAALNGNYTIGGTNPNFLTFNQASNNLRNGGVLGNVTFNVRDGKYIEQLTLDSIPFQNNFTITWQSESLDSSKVYLGYTGFNLDGKFGTVEVRRAKNQVVKHLTISAKKASCQIGSACNPSVSTTHNAIIAFQVKNNNIQFRNNHFIDSSYDVYQNGGGTSAYAFITNQYPSVVGAVPASLGSYDTLITIANNRFSKVNLANDFNNIIELKGISETSLYGFPRVTTVYGNLNKVNISGNTFAFNFTPRNGLLLKDVDTLTLVGNTIQGNTDIDGKEWARIDKNNFAAVTINAQSNRAINKPYIFSNNMVSNGLVASGDRINIIHNAIAFTDSTLNNSTLSLSGTRDTILNNIFYNPYGNAISANLPANSIANNNAFFASRISLNATTLAQWRAANAGQDMTSVEGINPYFRGPKDLHASNILLKIAPQLPAYTQDFDGQTRGAIVCFGADEFLQPANDLVVSYLSPNKIFPVGNNDVKVKIYNNGSNPITSFKASVSLTNYNYDSDAFPIPAGNLNYTYNGNIAVGASQEINLGQLNFPLNRNTLKINCTNTNAVADEVPGTDSIQINKLYAGLSGTYTYGVGGNFPNTDLLQKQLHFGGVATASTINVIAGTRSNNLILDSIPSLAQLVIQSADGDSSNTGFVGQQPIRLFRANNVVFRKLLLDGTTGNGIILGYNSKNITVENCLIKAGYITETNTGYYYPGYGLTIIGNYSGMTFYNDSGYTVRNNNFAGGGVGLAVVGSNNNYYLKQVKVTGNTFTNQVLGGMDLKSVDSVLISKNDINTNTTTALFNGISIDDTKGKIFIDKNKIYIKNDGVGINNFRSHWANSQPDSLRISNNFISVGATSADTKGIYVTLSKNTQVLYNSINNKSTSASSIALYEYAVGAPSLVANNIFYCKFVGIPVELLKDVSTTIPVQHHNLLFTSGNLYGKITNSTQFNGSTVNTYATLANLATSGIEYSSVSGNPLFVSETDLHTDGVAANNKGAYDVSITDDIDGEVRSASNPDIGADEFNLPNFGAVQLESPTSSCSHTTTEPVKVWVKNFGTQPRYNIPVAYKINNGTVVLDTIRTVVNAGDSTLFTFTQTANLLAPITYTFNVWSNYRGDSLPSNDTLKNVTVATTPANNILPYYTGFEGTNAGWYTTGQNKSFAWGVVYSGVIDSAANGLNAWKSNLTGPHNNNEFSYLYSPCIDLTGVNVDPTLNFNLAFQLENNTDKAWVEWSADGGAIWSKLGTQGQGLAWYNNAGNFWTGTYKQWHNAKISLPTGALTDKSKVRIRFVLQTNSSIVQDGLGIDDVSIYIGSNAPVSTGTYTNRTANSTGTGSFVAVNDPSGNRLIELNDNGQTLGTITVSVNQNNGGVPTTYNGQTFLGRNFVIRVQNQPTSPVRVRLFITQAEYDAWRILDPTIDLTRNIAVYKFSNSIEDFDISNNSGGAALTIQPAQIVKVPYLDGYFLEFAVTSFSEFWITKSNGSNIVLPVQFVSVKANLVAHKAYINWQVTNEVQVNSYQVMHSTDGINFSAIGSVAYQNGNGLYQFTHQTPKEGANYYRIKQIDNDGTYKFSTTVVVNKVDSKQIMVYPTVFENQFFVQKNVSNVCYISIYSVEGKQIVQKQLQNGTNTIDMTSVVAGTYLYRIISNGIEVSSGKLIKR